MRTDMRYVKKGLGSILSGLVLIGIIIASIFPFLYMFLMSFKSTINAHDLDFSLESSSLMQYQKIFALDDFGRYIFNSVFVAVAGVILTVGVCSLAGYAFAKMDFKGNDKIFLCLIMTMLVPTEVIVILDVPEDLVDAARIDGCGDLRIFFKVILPLIRSSVLALSIFTFVGAWNNFLWPLVASTKTEMKTLPLALSMMKTQFNTDVGLTMACAVINFLPPFVFYVFVQGRFKEGMTLSGMK